MTDTAIDIKQQLLLPSPWSDYELLDSGHGKRLERFGKYTIIRPDPQCLWKPSLPQSEWEKSDAEFAQSGKKGDEKGHWQTKVVPSKWLLNYKNLRFYAKLSPFKHTGIFPEQAANWDFIEKILTNLKTPPQPKILNLFGYTGIASLIAAQSGAQVTHIDASYPTIGWARENQKASGLEDKPVRWILDDCLKFVEREMRRGNKYEGIILDPPVLGHGPNGEKWEFNVSFPKLLACCIKLLSEKKLFIIINAYAISASSLMLENVLKDHLTSGSIESGELVLQESKSKRLLSTGIYARWSAQKG